MVCDFCQTEYSLDEAKKIIAAQGEHLHSHFHDRREEDGSVERTTTDSGVFEQEKNFYSDEEEDDLRVYSCQSCGGEIIGDKSMAATSCPYCNNNVVVASNLSGDLKPDLIIPFKLDKEAAKKALREFYKGRKLLPRVFKDENHIEEIKGLYVPFWLFSGTSNANISFSATKVNIYSDSQYRYTETNYYDIDRGGFIDFENVPVDGSSKISDIMMESIEPFNWNEAVDFSTYYLPGFLADRYDVESGQVISTAEDRIKASTLDSFRNTVSGYSSVTEKSLSYDLGKVDIKYALAPVWFLNTKWKGKYYAFAMNGQTGKIVGDDMPIDNRLKNIEMAKFGIVTFVIIYIIAMVAYPFIFG